METFGTKIRTKKRKRGAEDPMDDLLDTAQQLNTAIARMDGPLLSDYFAHRTKRHAPHLSFVELRDRRVPGTSAAKHRASIKITESSE